MLPVRTLAERNNQLMCCKHLPIAMRLHIENNADGMYLIRSSALARQLPSVSMRCINPGRLLLCKVISETVVWELKVVAIGNPDHLSVLMSGAFLAGDRNME